jgi:hypothetical protein
MKHQHHRTIVKREHPHAGRRRLLMLLAVITVVGAIGFLAGQRGVMPAPLTDDGTAALRDQNTQLRQQSEVDQQTLNELRQFMADQAAELVELRQTLVFYRDVVAPEEGEIAVILRQPSVQILAEPRQWQVDTVVHRGEGKDRQYRGELRLTMEGKLDGVPHTLELFTVDSGTKTGVFPLRFRYLQNIQAVISLPDAFVPETIESVVTLTKPVKDTVRRSDPWDSLAAAKHAAQ